MDKKDIGPVLVAGATGYVGSRLCSKLLEAGYTVRAMGRSLSKLRARTWASSPNVELVVANTADIHSLKEAASGCSAVYYLVHSMLTQSSFMEMDKQAAYNMLKACEDVGVERIIYLGGLGDSKAKISDHLKSRDQVGKILQSGKVPVTYLRAAMIIGSGSYSFEMLRYLVDRLPVMVTPRWVKTLNQPIAIRNVLEYLVGVLAKPETAGQTYDIGGPDVLSYQELMTMYADEAGLSHRWIIPVPVLTPRLSSLWVGLLTPLPTTLAKPLIEGLRTKVVCEDNRIREILPIPLIPVREAIATAIVRQSSDIVESSWLDAGALSETEIAIKGDPKWSGGTVYDDSRVLVIDGPASEVWKGVVRIGGGTGWYAANWLWKLRGAIDKMVGGVGLSRGRRSAREVKVGDALDFWRVKKVEPPSELKLIAEMKVPGFATLEFKLEQLTSEQTRLSQVAKFAPRGILGMVYWKAMLPFHFFIFRGMMKGISDSTRLRKRIHLGQPALMSMGKASYHSIVLINVSETGCRVSAEPGKYPKKSKVSLLLTGLSDQQLPFTERAITGQIMSTEEDFDEKIAIGIKFNEPQRELMDWLAARPA